MDIETRGSQLKTEERQGSQGPRQMTQISAHRLSQIDVANLIRYSLANIGIMLLTQDSPCKQEPVRNCVLFLF